MNFQPEGLQAPIIQVNRLMIKNKQSIGVIGSVGSGKSTLLKLIAGVLTPTAGTVSFGNFDTTAVNQAVLRRDVAFLGQSAGIFAGTVR